MLRVKLPGVISQPKKGNYRPYTSEALISAHSAVINEGKSLRKAAREFGVPVTTLHDRCSGRIDPSCRRSGPETFLSHEEEAQLVQHVEKMASFGYGYTRQDVITIATDLSVSLGKKHVQDKQLSLQWFYGFMDRWPQLKVQRPRSLDLHRAKATSENTVSHYYANLKTVLDQHHLESSPERIYNLDEKGLVENHKPPSVVASCGDVPAAVTLPRSATTTVIGCGNAIGNVIPPYFIFKGQRMRDDLLEGCIPGTAGTVSQSGWSNSIIFQKYLSEHFLKYCTAPTAEKPVLLLYDGHKSHISVSLSEWARERNIILFVLPAHTSHVLQPLDVGCFGPFEKIYCNLRHTYMRTHATQGVEKHSVCKLGCRAYMLALTPCNLQSSFRKCGIFPFDEHVISKNHLLPAQVFGSSDNIKSTQEFAQEISVPSGDQVSSSSQTVSDFFENIHDTTFKVAKPTKKRKYMSAIVGGRAITEPDTLNKMKDHEKSHPPAKKQVKQVSTGKKRLSPHSPVPSTSKVPSKNLESYYSDSSSDIVDDDEEVCCQCKLFQPVELKKCTSVIFVKWAQCTHSTCQHWTHLKFCTPVTVVRCHAEFWCPCHDKEE